jgi:hypothetical protein
MQHAVQLPLAASLRNETNFGIDMRPNKQQRSPAAFHRDSEPSVVVCAACSPQSFQGYQLWCNPRRQQIGNQMICYFGYFDGA